MKHCHKIAQNPGRRPRRSGGSALVLVLWVIAMLGMIVASFAFDAHLEGRITLFARRRARAEALSRSGFEIAKMLLAKQRGVNGNETDEVKEGDPWYGDAFSLHTGRSVTLQRELGEGTIRVDIEPEDGKGRNVNKLMPEDWERMFTSIGLPEIYWADLIDSFYDWTDEDAFTRDNGAEEDYYEDLDPPYAPANGPLSTVGELRLVKGFNEAIMTGGVFNPDDPEPSQIVLTNGIERMLTVFGEGKVNVNAVRQSDASLLMSLPGVEDMETALAVLDERETGNNIVDFSDDDEEDTSFKNESDFMSRVGDLLEDQTIREFVTTGSEYFRITSIGSIGRVTHKVSAVVYYDGETLRILRWQEEA